MRGGVVHTPSGMGAAATSSVQPQSEQVCTQQRRARKKDADTDEDHRLEVDLKA